MLKAVTVGAVHTRAHTQVILDNIFLRIFKKRNKDPYYGLRLLYLRI